MTARPTFSSQSAARPGAWVTTTRPSGAHTRAASMTMCSPRRPSTATPRITREKKGSPGAETIRLQRASSSHERKSASTPTTSTPSSIEAMAGPRHAGSPIRATVPGPWATPTSAARRCASSGSVASEVPASPDAISRRGGARRSPKPSSTTKASLQLGQPNVPSCTRRFAI